MVFVSRFGKYREQNVVAGLRWILCRGNGQLHWSVNLVVVGWPPPMQNPGYATGHRLSKLVAGERCSLPCVLGQLQFKIPNQLHLSPTSKRLVVITTYIVLFKLFADGCVPNVDVVIVPVSLSVTVFATSPRVDVKWTRAWDVSNNSIG